MKRTLNIIIGSVLLTASLLFITPAKAQEPPHPPTSGHGIYGNIPAGPSAPVDGGLGILIAFAAAYGFRKYTSDKS